MRQAQRIVNGGMWGKDRTLSEGARERRFWEEIADGVLTLLSPRSFGMKQRKVSGGLKCGRGTQGEHQERRGFRGSIDRLGYVPAGDAGICRDSQRRCAQEQHDRERHPSLRRQEAADPAQQSDQEEGANAGEAGARAGRVAGPFALDPDRKPDQARHGQAGRGFEFRIHGLKMQPGGS